MIDLNDAVHIARRNIDALVPGAQNIQIEEAVTSDDDTRYEITYSYEVERTASTYDTQSNNVGFMAIANILGRKREFKTFIVDMDGKFKGFKRYKGN